MVWPFLGVGLNIIASTALCLVLSVLASAHLLSARISMFSVAAVFGYSVECSLLCACWSHVRDFLMLAFYPVSKSVWCHHATVVCT